MHTPPSALQTAPASSNEEEDGLLMLSGIQHYDFCPRQWALIYIDQQWEDNRLTVEGAMMHERVDDPFFKNSCGAYTTVRSLPVVSRKLGLYGVADIIEMRPEGPYPVEYKHGRPKHGLCDQLQLCAYAMCLEEMYATHIPEGAFFYGATRRRTPVNLTDALRKAVITTASQMHAVWEAGVLPAPPHDQRSCPNCSLVNLCLPSASAQKKVKSYLQSTLYTDFPPPTPSILSDSA